MWKTFEEQHGTPEDVAKVESKKPIISKRRRVDQENGQMVEGRPFYFARNLLKPNHRSAQNTSSFSPTTKRKATLHLSNSCKSHTPGKPHNIQKAALHLLYHLQTMQLWMKTRAMTKRAQRPVTTMPRRARETNHSYFVFYDRRNDQCFLLEVGSYYLLGYLHCTMRI